MWVANWAVGYVNHRREFSDEREAEKWLEGELRRTGASRGVVYEREGEVL